MYNRREKPNARERLARAVENALAEPQLRTLLARCIADALVRELAGERIYLPKEPRGDRNASIREEHASGATVRELAERHNLSRSRVYEILGVDG